MYVICTKYNIAQFDLAIAFAAVTILKFQWLIKTNIYFLLTLHEGRKKRAAVLLCMQMDTDLLPVSSHVKSRVKDLQEHGRGQTRKSEVHISKSLWHSTVQS